MSTRLLEPALVEALGRLAAGARRTALGPSGGLHKSPFKGASIDFRQHRLYTPGDDVRRLDWRVLARTDRPFIREYDDETTRRTILILDASGSMAYGKPVRKFDVASQLIAAFAYVALAGGDGAGLVLAGEDVAQADQWVAPASGPKQLGWIVGALERCTPGGPTSLEATLRDVSARVGRRALVIIVSDLLLPVDSLRRGLAALRHGRHDLTVIRTLHPDEQNFPFRGWLRFGGMEREADSVGESAMTRSRYLRRFEQHQQQLRQACLSASTLLVDHPVGRPLLATIGDVVQRRRR